MTEPDVEPAPERPNAVVLRDGRGGEIVISPSELSRLLSMALDLQTMEIGAELREPPRFQEAWEIRRQNEQLRDRVRLVNKRLLQLEAVLQGAFARTVKALSGDRPEAQQGADRAVRIIDDHTRALQLLRRAGVECDRVSAGIQRLLDERDGVIAARAEQRDAEQAIEISRFEMTIEQRERSSNRHCRKCGVEHQRGLEIFFNPACPRGGEHEWTMESTQLDRRLLELPAPPEEEEP